MNQTMYNSLERFVDAQKDTYCGYDAALAEMKDGEKRNHWMWYIFPQLRGLGSSSMSDFYGVQDLQEAIEYLNHPVLRPRLIEISNAVLQAPSNDPIKVMGIPDNMKLRSCMTLFAAAAPEQSVFQDVLQKFFNGKQDKRTLHMIAAK